MHPSYKHISNKVLELGIGMIDEDKSQYFERYSVFVGCVSTLLKTSKENGKCVYAIGFDEDQLEYMSANLSGFKIIDGRK